MQITKPIVCMHGGTKLYLTINDANYCIDWLGGRVEIVKQTSKDAMLVGGEDRVLLAEMSSKNCLTWSLI